MTPSLAGLVAEEDVLGDRQQRNQRQFLVDDDDAEMLAVGDAGEARAPRPRRRSRLRRSRADRRRSAPSSASICRRRSRRKWRGFRRPHREIDVAQRFHAGKALRMPRISRIAFMEIPSGRSALVALVVPATSAAIPLSATLKASLDRFAVACNDEIVTPYEKAPAFARTRGPQYVQPITAADRACSSRCRPGPPSSCWRRPRPASAGRTERS